MMKRVILGMVAASFLFSLPVWAEDKAPTDILGVPSEKSKENSMVDKVMMKEKRMCCPHMMGKTQMVATTDGSVIILAGNKLMKYDSDLDLEKEVEVKMPMMGDKQCPIKKMKEERKKEKALAI